MGRSHEEGGESIAMVQNRNIEVLNEILSDNMDKDIALGTHGTALSTILNYRLDIRILVVPAGAGGKECRGCRHSFYE